MPIFNLGASLWVGIDQQDAVAGLVERPGMRVVPLIRYPYKILQNPRSENTPHCHAARRPWAKER